MKRASVITVIFFLLLSCRTLPDSSKGESKTGTRIRYVNLEAVYAFMLKKNSESLKLMLKRKDIESRIEKNEMTLVRKGRLPEIINEKEILLVKLKKLEKDEEALKSVVLKKIKYSIKRLADRYRVDLILNSSENFLFGKREFDLTGEVIRELILFEKRTEPVSR